MYDPALGRFTCLDPLAEDFHWVSPYNYAENSPIANIDLWGLQAYYAADGSVIGQVGVSTEVRVVNSTLTNAQATTLVQNSASPLIGSGDAQQQLIDNSTTFVDYAENVNDVLNDAPLESWADNGQNCYAAATAQMDNAGQESENKYQAIQTDVNNSIQPANQQLTENTVGGAINIMTELKAGNPVKVGVKEVGTDGNVVNAGNYNRNTGHFVVVSSMQKNGSNVTFGYYDNANAATGKSSGNRFSVSTTTGTMQDNTNVGVGGVQSYTVSEVRKNKP